MPRSVFAVETMLSFVSFRWSPETYVLLYAFTVTDITPRRYLKWTPLSLPLVAKDNNFKSPFYLHAFGQMYKIHHKLILIDSNRQEVQVDASSFSSSLSTQYSVAAHLVDTGVV